MDPRLSVQDVIRCDLCETAIVQMYCDFCHVNLCKPCIGEHISDDYEKHKIVPFQQRKSTLIYPKCATHQAKTCDIYCKECDIPLCSICAISDSHKKHKWSTLFETYNLKRETIEKDLEELENRISPTYKEIVTDTETQIANLDREYGELTTALKQHGEEWHREIDIIVNKLTAEITEMKNKHLDILKKHLDEIKKIQSVIEHTLLHLKNVVESNEISTAMEFSSKDKDFSKLPPRVLVSLPTFTPKVIDREQLYMLIGSLTPLSTTTEENGYTLKKPKTATRELLEESELITTINTGYKYLCCVICLSEEEIWTSAHPDSEIKCFCIQGSHIKKIKTATGERPNDIAVTKDGDLVYADWKTRSVNKVKNGQTEEVIRLQGWVPCNLCVTSSGDLLVTMHSDDETQSKLVRFSGSAEKQTIKFDDEGKPLYSGNNTIKYINENRNLDICVADCGAGALVVVNQTGKLRFRYTGHLSATKNKPFEPRGITTDSQGQILTADSNNHCIHILDQNGQFLRFIDNCDLKNPWGVCVDKNDNLFVAEFKGNVKKIKYLL
ncbi:uncharacterized protein LOC133187580 [Saccostrea echinata]|uniref:uncharacterized protein LOC133187580 n=1 Tax=Saccostrea echinata TaxID=191078 RepID=UPI002A81EB64|nr:uncharacterized protein LOC133187580 [Saccostrea echinata]